MTSVRAGAAVDDDGHEVIHAIWVDGIIRLKESVLLERENSEAEQQWLKGHQTPTMATFQHTKFKYISPMITVLKIFFTKQVDDQYWSKVCGVIFEISR